jgi:hypothetical protein
MSTAENLHDTRRRRTNPAQRKGRRTPEERARRSRNSSKLKEFLKDKKQHERPHIFAGQLPGLLPVRVYSDPFVREFDLRMRAEKLSNEDFDPAVEWEKLFTSYLHCFSPVALLSPTKEARPSRDKYTRVGQRPERWTPLTHRVKELADAGSEYSEINVITWGELHPKKTSTSSSNGWKPHTAKVRRALLTIERRDLRPGLMKRAK